MKTKFVIRTSVKKKKNFMLSILLVAILIVMSSIATTGKTWQPLNHGRCIIKKFKIADMLQNSRNKKTKR